MYVTGFFNLFAECPLPVLAAIDHPVRSFLSVWIFAITGGVILTIWATLYVWEWIQSRPKKDSKPVDLFVGLCAAHNLGANAIEKIRSIAENRQLKDPSILFVDPMYLTQSGISDPESAKLASELFGSTSVS